MDIINQIKSFVKENVSFSLAISLIFGLISVSLLENYGWTYFIPASLQFQGNLFLWILLSYFWLKIFTFVWIQEFMTYLYNSWIKSTNSRTYVTNFKSSLNFENDWIRQGYSHIGKEGLVVTDSDAGILLSSDWFSRENKWKDFRLVLHVDFNVENNYRKILGVVFRAKDLNDYFMVQIWKNGEEVLVRPHVRVEGNWDAPSMDNRTFVTKTRPIKGKRKYLVLEIILLNNLLTIKGDVLNQVDWQLPTHSQINLGYLTEEDKKNNLRVKPVVFRNKAGMIGFRNTQSEKVVVKYLSIESINEHEKTKTTNPN